MPFAGASHSCVRNDRAKRREGCDRHAFFASYLTDVSLSTSGPNDKNRGKEMRFMRRIIVKVMLVSLVAVAVAVAAGVTVTPRPAKAEFPGKNGRIAFMKQDSAEHWQTWVANKDLSNQVKLTRGSADSGWAVWNPGGTKLAFDSNRADPDPDDAECHQRHLQDEPRWDGTRQADPLRLQRCRGLVPRRKEDRLRLRPPHRRGDGEGGDLHNAKRR